VEQAFRNGEDNDDLAGYALAKRVFAGELTWLEAGVFNQDDLIAAAAAKNAAQATKGAS
jgi:hypothetical protein